MHVLFAIKNVVFGLWVYVNDVLTLIAQLLLLDLVLW